MHKNYFTDLVLKSQLLKFSYIDPHKSKHSLLAINIIEKFI
jgi:hypothetical protein